MNITQTYSKHKVGKKICKMSYKRNITKEKETKMPQINQTTQPHQPQTTT